MQHIAEVREKAGISQCNQAVKMLANSTKRFPPAAVGDTHDTNPGCGQRARRIPKYKSDRFAGKIVFYYCYYPNFHCIF